MERVGNIGEGLDTYMLHPKTADGKPKFSGLQLFEHLRGLAARSVPRHTELRPSTYLDVEISREQRVLLNPTDTDYTMHAIASVSHGDGAKKKLRNESWMLLALFVDIAVLPMTQHV